MPTSTSTREPAAPSAAGLGDNPESIARILRAMLPERTLDDIFARRAVIALGDEEIALRVLSIDANERWVATFRTAMDELTAGMAADANPLAVISFLQGMPEIQIRLLRAYDEEGGGGQLPTDAEIRATATAPQLITGLFVTMAAAFPLAVVLLQLALDNADVRTLMAAGLRESTSTPPANGAGTPAGSGAS